MSDNLINITRVDMYTAPTGVIVQSFEDGWRTTNTANESHLNYSTSLADMITWFQAHGWTVRTWGKGARAFKGAPRPVRDPLQAKMSQRIHEVEYRCEDWQIDG